ncbi:hypothetical protein VCUG_00180 [Vavraia culicis subsp. floridensis]|uniref:Uncharacterized protein n=1 Tax=Vavraia culicis (isolate floridensis) TaxID=948595 RepID=L2GXI3_VAVCU|nr:uncharacterized protein VCUG_00180 [Vavraia culicis subsp. floridensis]XP_008074824.1 uncharacterized protein VCUG_01810 [Vavraia culicis subsp. floridensis]ELA46724.1 hypothetical protein VCUG_01810 [Vavraia culicis subsp. floridensis]ELA48344.1 hypothetical protein VCUG_00180 [Vavraia culicis subsp. floridensis]
MHKITSIYAQQTHIIARKIQNSSLEGKVNMLKHYNVPVIIFDFCGGILKYNTLIELNMSYYFVFDYESVKNEINSTIEGDDIVFLLFDWRLNEDVKDFMERKTKKNVFILINSK